MGGSGEIRRLKRVATIIANVYISYIMALDKRKRKSPSYKGFTSSSEAQTRAKRANKSSGTKPEVVLRKEMHRLGLRFRLKTGHLPGRPDIIFPASRVAVFCDGDFWHGRDWENLQTALRKRANSDYWIAKIGYNRERDIEVTRSLSEIGWRVMRLWESEIISDPAGAARRVKRFAYPDSD